MKRALGIALVFVAAALLPAAAAAKTPAQQADAALDRALRNLVAMPGGPPGVIALVQRGNQLRVHTAGYGDVATKRRPRATDHMRVASVAKAFSGGVALSLVNKGVLSLDDTIGQRLPDLPQAWHAVTLRQLLNHTSGLPDFTASPALQQAFLASLTVAPPPGQLLEYVKDDPLNFAPGSEYRYSNSDNIAVGLMVEAATGHSYEDELQAQVAMPFALTQTTLPRGPDLPSPYIHGYDLGDDGQLEDVSEICGYVGGKLFGAEVQSQQRQFIAGGGSEPPGPGSNSAGLALFRYQTRCGTVFGHTGNTFGFTQFTAATSDGSRSATVSINLQRTQDSEGQAGAVFRALRRAELFAVCAALAR
jgi:D-alanyl-D-alanine carboxypeptidase